MSTPTDRRLRDTYHPPPDSPFERRWVEIDRIDHVLQAKVDAATGDCAQACWASLLRIPLSDVPPFHPELRGKVPVWGWDWLLRRGIWIEYWHRQPDGTFQRQPGDPLPAPPGYSIASVPSAVFPGASHAVIALDGRVVWDPSPYAKTRVLPYDVSAYEKPYWTDDGRARRCG